MAGYHTKEIKKGILGELSKIQEELDELADAEQQDVKVLMLCELCDLIGSIEAYLKSRFTGLEIKDLHAMAKLTSEAFRVGQR